MSEELEFELQLTIDYQRTRQLLDSLIDDHIQDMNNEVILDALENLWYGASDNLKALLFFYLIGQVIGFKEYIEKRKK